MPPEKLCLEVKNVASRMPPSSSGKHWSPAELLRMMLSPPDAKRTLACAERLDELGALTGPGDEAELTTLGCLMSALPLDGRLCRLVLFGCLFGAPCDAVVMAAGLAVQDPFSAPEGRHFSQSYAMALRKSYSARRTCDAGHLSEPLMLRSLFVQWLRRLHADLGAASDENRAALLRPSYARCARELTVKLAASPARLTRFAALVVEIAIRLKPFLPSNCEALFRVDALLALLREPDSAVLPPLDDVFCQDPWQLKALLACAFAPQFLSGEVRLEEGRKGGPREMLGELVAEGFDPSRSIVLSLEGARSRDASLLKGLQQTLQTATGTSARLAAAEGNRVFVGLNEEGLSTQASDEREGAMLEAEEDLPRMLPEAAGIVDGLGAGRDQLTLLLVVSDSGKLSSQMVTVSRPVSPYAVAWEVLPAIGGEAELRAGKGAKAGGKRAARQQKLAARCDWRNPLGMLASCSAPDEVPPPEGWSPECLPQPAVTRLLAVYTSAATGPVPEGGGPISNTTNVSGVTLLGAEADSRASLALALAFLRQQHEVELEVSPDTGCVEAVRLFGTTEFRLRERGVQELLLLEDLEKLNDVRRALSAAFQGTTDGGGRSLGRRSSKSLLPEELGQSGGDDVGLVALLGDHPQLGSRDSDAVTEALLALRLALRVPRPEEEVPPPASSRRSMRMRQPPGDAFRLFWPIEDPSEPQAAEEAAAVEPKEEPAETWAEDGAVQEPALKRARHEDPGTGDEAAYGEEAPESFAEHDQAPAVAAEAGEEVQDAEMAEEAGEWAAEGGEAAEAEAEAEQGGSWSLEDIENAVENERQQQGQQQQQQQEEVWEWKEEESWAEEAQQQAAAVPAGRRPRRTLPLAPTPKMSAGAGAGRNVPPRRGAATAFRPSAQSSRSEGQARSGGSAIGAAARARQQSWR